jgi:hypothetical protein
MNNMKTCLEQVSDRCVVYTGDPVEGMVNKGASLDLLLNTILIQLNELSTEVKGLKSSLTQLSLSSSNIETETKLLSPAISTLVPDAIIDFSVAKANTKEGIVEFNYDLSKVTRNLPAGTKVEKVSVIGKSDDKITFNTTSDVGGAILSNASTQVDVEVQLHTPQGKVFLNKTLPVNVTNPGSFKVNMDAKDLTSVAKTTLKDQMTITENEIINLKTQVQNLQNQLTKS